MKNEISTKELIEAAKQCSRRAIERAEALGIPYTIRKGNNIVRVNPDGSVKILKEMEPRVQYKGKKVISL